MKRKLLLFSLLLALFAPWAAQAQTTVEIGDGTSTDYYTPIGTYYNYSITEQLYTAAEIGTAGTISSISFNYASSTAKDFPITVYMRMLMPKTFQMVSALPMPMKFSPERFP